MAANIDIGMKAESLELDLGRLKGIVIGEREQQSVLSPLENRVFASIDGPFPAEYVVFLRKRRYPRISTHL